MLAGKFFDGVVGVDIHWELVPAPPSPVPIPTPFPNPFVGMVFDPIGLGVGLVISNVIGLVCGDPPTGPVLVNFVPAANTGTDVKGFGHILIPPGTGWAPMPSVKPAIKPDDVTEPDNPGMPDNDGTIVTGSKTVHVMGSNWSRLGDMVMTCSEPVRLPSSVLLATPKGLPVLVGGPPTLDFFAAAGALLRSRWVSDRLHALVNRLAPERWRSFLHRAVCFFTGHPVDVATGRVLTYHTDFELPGPLPLSFERSYDSSFAFRASPLGYGWHHSLHQRVWVERGKVVYLADDGRELEFDTFDFPDHAMRAGDRVFEPVHRMTLECVGGGKWRIWSWDGVAHEFAPVVGGPSGVSCLVSKQTRDGHHRIELNYDARGSLEWVRDSGGRRIRFEHDAHGRLARVLLPVPRGDGHYDHMRYRFDAAGDLVEATDPAGKSWTFEYAGHLLTRETDRNGLSFYFGYDGIGPSAWCVRTWGDGGIYDHELAYDKTGRVTAVTNSLGETTIYKMNALGLVTEVADPHGHSTKYEYAPESVQRSAEIDPLGNATRTFYDARGNCVRVEHPDGSVLAIEYGPLDLPVRAVDPNGGEWRWQHDAYGRLEAHGNPLGHWARYEYDDGLLARYVSPGGNRFEFEYDSAKNVVSASIPGGTLCSEHDALGRIVKRVDMRGGIERREYDIRGDAIRVHLAHGVTRSLEYDAEQNLVGISDGWRNVRLTYTGYYRLQERVEPGGTVRFHYDTEDRLRTVENENGERYELELDARGLVVREQRFDGSALRFTHDAAGRVTAVETPSAARTSYAYDAAGRCTEIRYPDGTFERYRYRADGALVEATNPDAELLLEVDALGRVVREACRRTGGAETWIESGLGPDGQRFHLRSSDGHREHIHRDDAGRVDRIEIDRGGSWQVTFERDAVGLELARRFPSGLELAWQRDAAGRPTRRRVLFGGNSVTERRFEWESDDFLRAVTDDRLGRTDLVHDARGRLVRARHPWGEDQHRAMDPASNVYRMPDGRDRTYGPGGRVLEVDGTRYEHDADGRIVRKVDPLGQVTELRWSAAGRLREVALPSGRVVRFAYDAFARRISKAVVDSGCDHTLSETRWTWDGHVPLTELSSDHGRTTWVFEPDTFTPLAKIAGGSAWGVLPDPLGAPAELVDEAGALAWQMQLDLYGAARIGPHETTCDFRFPGQQWDDDVALSYNGFRYYDPALGSFISPDPIALWGGHSPYGYPVDPFAIIDPLGLDGHHTVPNSLMGVMHERGWINSATREALRPAGTRPGLVQLNRGAHTRIHGALNDYLNTRYSGLSLSGFPRSDAWSAYVQQAGSYRRVMADLSDFYENWLPANARSYRLGTDQVRRAQEAFRQDADAIRRGRRRCPG